MSISTSSLPLFLSFHRTIFNSIHHYSILALTYLYLHLYLQLFWCLTSLELQRHSFVIKHRFFKYKWLGQGFGIKQFITPKSKRWGGFGLIWIDAVLSSVIHLQRSSSCSSSKLIMERRGKRKEKISHSSLITRTDGQLLARSVARLTDLSLLLSLTYNLSSFLFQFCKITCYRMGLYCTVPTACSWIILEAVSGFLYSTIQSLHQPSNCIKKMNEKMSASLLLLPLLLC